MDFQNRPGAKTGGGGAATQGMADRWGFFYILALSSFFLHLELSFARERRERLAALAAETIDLAKVANQTSIEHRKRYYSGVQNEMKNIFSGSVFQAPNVRILFTQDPYFMRNHLGTYECKLCLTLHNNEASYLAHTQVSKSNLEKGVLVTG